MKTIDQVIETVLNGKHLSMRVDGPAPLEFVEELERTIGSRLPAEYRRLCLELGPFVIGQSCSYSLGTACNGEALLDELVQQGLLNGDDYDVGEFEEEDPEYEYEMEPDCRGLLPLFYDPLDGLFLVATSMNRIGASEGEVIIYDHLEPAESSLKRRGESVGEFLRDRLEEESSKIHVVHDVDRDGWGSAAFVVSNYGDDICRLHPTRSKDVLPLVQEVAARAKPGDQLWVLDLPAPATFDGFQLPERVSLTWVDHHPFQIEGEVSVGVRLVLHQGNKATTAMHMLEEHELVSVSAHQKRFRSSLCGRGAPTDWVRVIDALDRYWPEVPVEREDLPALLEAAIEARPVPQELQGLIDRIGAEGDVVEEILSDAPRRCEGGVVVVELGNCRGIPLKMFSLAAQKKWGCAASLLVHRKRTLYGGTLSSNMSVDFLAHWRGRGLTPKGHPYVAFVDVPSPRIDEEVQEVVEYLKKGLCEAPAANSDV